MKLEDEKDGNIESRRQKKRAPETNLRDMILWSYTSTKRSDKKQKDDLVEDEICRTTKIERD